MSKKQEGELIHWVYQSGPLSLLLCVVRRRAGEGEVFSMVHKHYSGGKLKEIFVGFLL